MTDYRELIAEEQGCSIGELEVENSNWVSVKDRLPNFCGMPCLLCAFNKFGQVKVFEGFTGYMERGRLEFHSNNKCCDIKVWEVTHWMPFPKAPNIERKEFPENKTFKNEEQEGIPFVVGQTVYVPYAFMDFENLESGIDEYVFTGFIDEREFGGKLSFFGVNKDSNINYIVCQQIPGMFFATKPEAEVKLNELKEYALYLYEMTLDGHL